MFSGFGPSPYLCLNFGDMIIHTIYNIHTEGQRAVAHCSIYFIIVNNYKFHYHDYYYILMQSNGRSEIQDLKRFF